MVQRAHTMQHDSGHSATSLSFQILFKGNPCRVCCSSLIRKISSGQGGTKNQIKQEHAPIFHTLLTFTCSAKYKFRESYSCLSLADGSLVAVNLCLIFITFKKPTLFVYDLLFLYMLHNEHS